MTDDRMKEWNQAATRYLETGEGREEFLALDRELREAGLLPKVPDLSRR